MIYLHKILPVFVMPIMLIIYLLIYSLWKKKRWPVYTAIICLYVFSTPIFASSFFKLIEGSEPRKTPKDMPKADAIVVLSGMINKVKSTDSISSEWGDADRFFGGIELFKAGKAPKIIFTRGKMPWDTTLLTEGDILKRFAIGFGVPDTSIVLTSKVENTNDEVNSIMHLMGNEKSIILVTSAFHMKRAKYLFEKSKFKVIPYKVDFKSNGVNNLTLIDFLPDISYFNLIQIALWEFFGLEFYKLKQTISK